MLAELKRDGKPSAVDEFKRIVQSEELHSLNLRDALEWQLIFVLNENKQVPLEFVVAVVDFFDWRERRDLKQSGAGTPLQAILSRVETRTMLEELRELATSNSSRTKTDRPPAQRKAARALLSRFSSWRCVWAGLSRPMLFAVNTLLLEIDERAPDLPQTHLDPKTVAWWRNKLSKPMWTFSNMRIGLFFAVVFWTVTIASLQSAYVHPLVLLLAIAVGVNVAFYAFVRALHFWKHHWGPRFTIWSARAKERTLGRFLPGAVNRGLGWRHLMIALAYSLLIALSDLENWTVLERTVGFRLTFLVVMVLATSLVFTAYVLRFQLWHLMASAKKPKWNAFRVSGYLTVGVVALAVLASVGLNHSGLLMAAILAVLLRLYARAHKR